ncbi:MAG: hypothetical protein ABIZ04_06115 [Opitutus sp.]
MLLGIVLGGGLVLARIQAGLDAETAAMFQGAAKVMIFGVVPLIQVGLLMGLLHDDSVVALDVFWLTRPISGVELLAAKALGWMMIGIVPVAVSVPFWLTHDFGWAQIGAAAQQALRAHFLIAVVALPFAMMSVSGSKFVMSLIVAGGGILLFSLVLQLGTTPGEEGVPRALIQTRAWLACWIWIATALTVAANQFLRRRTRTSRALLAVAVVGVLFIVACWPWTLGAFRDGSATSTSAVRPNGVESIDRAEIRTDSKPSGDRIGIPLRDGAVVSRRGVTLYIQTAFLDWTGKLDVSFGEATPTPFERFSELMPGAMEPPNHASQYFIRHRITGAMFRVNPTELPNRFNAAAERFCRLSFSTRPAAELAGRPAVDVAEWMEDAELIRFADDAHEPEKRVTGRRISPR